MIEIFCSTSFSKARSASIHFLSSVVFPSVLFVSLDSFSLPKEVSRNDAAIELYNRGTRIMGKSPHQAISLFEAAIERDPDLFQAHVNLGTVLKKQGRSLEAKKAYESALFIAPYDDIGLNQLGSLLVSMGKYQDAVRKTEVCVQKNLPICLELHGHALDKAGLHAKSYEIYTRLAKMFPLRSEIHQSRCSTAVRAGRNDLFEIALDDWERLLPNDPLLKKLAGD
ncbi:MAG: tetratricopeptide repeat protein [Deltaproteobacteria bacterium]|jgi:predicted Zn-dependent protease|nr:tetratricopeptide repeat protein [Deltaproteobacteria bacterium]